jgi:nitrite reductase/ring-hydroxylating ferredoxin subunit
MIAAEAYTEGERFQVEKRRLFARAWLPFCAAGQLAAAGDFVSHTLGGWPIVAIRGSDGVVRAFRNVCKHQGMPVVERPSGQCAALRCRYHGWTYDLAGALTAAPPLVAPADPGAAIHHLDALRRVEVDGIVQVRDRGDADAPATLGAGGRAYVDALSLDVDANWKSAVEAGLADAAWRFVWPLAFVAERGALCVVRQVVPRSFTRTRLIDLVFADGAIARDALNTDLQRAKAAAQAAQQARAAGDGGAPDTAIDAFRARLAAACTPGA